jgi:hypothetical protein
MAGKIPLSRVYHSELIDRRILDVVKGGNYILGPECKEFEKELATYFGVPHVVLSSSWTAAVHLLHIAQGLMPGDEVLVPSLTAFPSIEPMIHVGAKPVFCDIDDTYTICPEDAKKRITKKTVGILPVHLYGRPANIDGTRRLQFLSFQESDGVWRRWGDRDQRSGGRAQGHDAPQPWPQGQIPARKGRLQPAFQRDPGGGGAGAA